MRFVSLCSYVCMYFYIIFSYVTPKQINWCPEKQKRKNSGTGSIGTKIRSTVVLKMIVVLFFSCIKKGRNSTLIIFMLFYCS
jgi:hypothetical protein